LSSALKVLRLRLRLR